MEVRIGRGSIVIRSYTNFGGAKEPGETKERIFLSRGYENKKIMFSIALFVSLGIVNLLCNL
jgi:hypothetical protein